MSTIAALATPPGQGGVAIIRVSGPDAAKIAYAMTRKKLPPRYAQYGHFYDADGAVIDEGVALFFQGPNSFTGEDVFECQGHAGPVVMDRLLAAALAAGAELAQPGEFSKRAFLNNKIDLVQAEAIADLIAATTEQAANAALSSLRGEFSSALEKLHQQLVDLRTFVEAALDFPDEEIDFLTEYGIADKLQILHKQLGSVYEKANQGCLLQEGMSIALIGQPNVGKSSLLNILSGQDKAIVTPIAGTTRDTLSEQIQLDGLPLKIIDTAGLRETNDLVEKEGIKRALSAIEKADRVLLVVDAVVAPSNNLDELWPSFVPTEVKNKAILCKNKCDLAQQSARLFYEDELPVVILSAKTGEGYPELVECLKQAMGYVGGEGVFTARRRHLDALGQVLSSVENALSLVNQREMPDLVAEELKLGQLALGSVTGHVSSDDLLGEIFSSFCIGK